ncbi:MAG: diguanylate cyclase [Chloroflexi bacterium]|nr:diguanylate cyclase [Chloroflexota bacterium]
MPGKFLLASQNNQTLRALQIALRDDRHAVTVARDGLEAVDLALDRSPNAIFLGVELTGLAGLDVARALRALDPTEHVPIIFLAEDANEAHRANEARLPITEVLTAPFELLQVKQRALAALRTGERIAILRQRENDAALIAITDPLTQLYHRRYIMHRLAYEAARSARYATPLTVVLVDIDNLTEVNQRYGVLQGDEVLMELGQMLKKLARTTDVLGRYDAQDFILLTPQTDAQGAHILADRICTMTASHVFGVDQFKITVSVGVASSAGKDLTENLSLVGRSAAALDRAKQSGKNRVEVG